MRRKETPPMRFKTLIAAISALIIGLHALPPPVLALDAGAVAKQLKEEQKRTQVGDLRLEDVDPNALKPVRPSAVVLEVTPQASARTSAKRR